MRTINELMPAPSGAYLEPVKEVYKRYWDCPALAFFSTTEERMLLMKNPNKRARTQRYIVLRQVLEGEIRKIKISNFTTFDLKEMDINLVYHIFKYAAIQSKEGWAEFEKYVTEMSIR